MVLLDNPVLAAAEFAWVRIARDKKANHFFYFSEVDILPFAHDIPQVSWAHGAVEDNTGIERPKTTPPLEIVNTEVAIPKTPGGGMGH